MPSLAVPACGDVVVQRRDRGLCAQRGAAVRQGAGVTTSHSCMHGMPRMLGRTIREQLE